MSKKLFAGPWVGEFGWELFTRQAYLRKIAKLYDHITVCARPDREFLYQDFTNKFIPFAPPSENVTMWANYGLDERFINRVLASPSGTEWLDPRAMLPNLYNQRKNIKGLTVLETFTPPDQEFIPYEKVCENNTFDIVIHARNRTDAKAWPEKNWQVQNWEKLVAHFHANRSWRIACVGHPSASHNIKDTTDLRGIPLQKLADVLANSKLCAGCSDGLLNFAALCKTPRLIWTIASEAEKNIDRHTKCWNPFNALVKMIIHKTWWPEVTIVKTAIEKYYD